jgi:hypothetical protein
MGAQLDRGAAGSSLEAESWQRWKGDQNAANNFNHSIVDSNRYDSQLTIPVSYRMRLNPLKVLCFLLLGLGTLPPAPSFHIILPASSKV